MIQPHCRFIPVVSKDTQDEAAFLIQRQRLNCAKPQKAEHSQMEMFGLFDYQKFHLLIREARKT